jgi:hypothetical protein
MMDSKQRWFACEALAYRQRIDYLPTIAAMARACARRHVCVSYTG